MSGPVYGPTRPRVEDLTARADELATTLAGGVEVQQHGFYPPPALDPKALPSSSPSCPTCGKPPLIFARIAAAIGDIQAVGKAGWNKEHAYAFRTIDDFYTALSPALSKHGLVIQPNVTWRERTLAGKTRNGADIVRLQVRYRYRIFTVDGSFMEADVDSESIDYGGDKAPFKAASGAYKYLCMQVFAVRVADEKTDEPEDESVEGRRRPRRQREASGPPPSQWTGDRAPPDRDGPNDDAPVGVDEPGPETEAFVAELTAALAKVGDLVAFQAWADRWQKAPAPVRAQLKAPGKARKAELVTAIADAEAKAAADAAARAAENPVVEPAPDPKGEPCWVVAPASLQHGGPRSRTCQKQAGHGGDHADGAVAWPNPAKTRAAAKGAKR